MGSTSGNLEREGLGGLKKLSSPGKSFAALDPSRHLPTQPSSQDIPPQNYAFSYRVCVVWPITVQQPLKVGLKSRALAKRPESTAKMHRFSE